jgi:hypothetical protein
VTARFPGEYPSKPRLSRAERLRVLSQGAELKWFEPWAEFAVLLPTGRTGQPFRCGFVHVLNASTEPEGEIHVFHDREGLAWALEHLYRKHPAHNADCRLYYFTPDLPLRIVIELDQDAGDEDEDEDEDEPGVSR